MNFQEKLSRLLALSEAWGRCCITPKELEKMTVGQLVVEKDKLEVHISEIAAELARVLSKIIKDGTGDVERPERRVWPIRSENYRAACDVLRRYNGGVVQ